MTAAWPRGRRGLRVFGFPVEVDPTFLVLAVLLGAGLGGGAATLVLFVAVLFGAILWHELGHALAFRAFGFSPEISVHGMGGHTATGQALSPGRDILVSLAGPVAGLVLGGLVLATASPVSPVDADGVVDVTLSLVASVNLGLGLFNLIPMLPLDGGRVMAGAFSLGLGRRRGQGAALGVSLTVAVGGAALAFASGRYILAALAGWYGYGNLRDLEALRAAAPERPPATEGDFEGWLDYGWSSLGEGASAAAASRAREVLAGRCPLAPPLRRGALRLLLWACLARGDHDQAAALVASTMDATSPVLDPQVLAAIGGPDRAIDQMRALYEHDPGDATGAFLARGLIEANRLDEAVAVVDGPWARLLGHETHSAVGSALFGAGRYAEAARMGERSFERRAHPALGYNIACSWARSGEVELALRWLGKAVDAGFGDTTRLQADEDFAAVRRAPGFAALQRRLAAARPVAASPGSGAG
jgi:stage IV sporulation protein FB